MTPNCVVARFVQSLFTALISAAPALAQGTVMIREPLPDPR